MDAFGQRFPGLTDRRLLLDHPAEGKIALSDGEWSFVKHGAGLRFRRQGEGVQPEVDLCDRPYEPTVFDAWRLETYLLSIGVKTPREDLLDELVELEGAGFIKQVDASHYKMSPN